MMDLIRLVLAFVIVFVVPLFLWGRGIVHGNKGDIIAASIIALIVSGMLIIMGASNIIGILLLLSGITTIIAGYFSNSNCPLSKTDRIIIAVLLFIVVAFFWFPIL